MDFCFCLDLIVYHKMQYDHGCCTDYGAARWNILAFVEYTARITDACTQPATVNNVIQGLCFFLGLETRKDWSEKLPIYMGNDIIYSCRL